MLSLSGFDEKIRFGHSNVNILNEIYFFFNIVFCVDTRQAYEVNGVDGFES